ncbi:hypothetical protein FNV43_RR11104 [Rhamnella rubrinervis]|uniref:Uncharacterized protein n=1 Tax=Rhamnella rubrinervis TaxID=2594499 RepID=A0A8K0MHF0_9ROSA|nr:hypothetical protein FNV43_RR11104 [Rhamnella rubrinervis]
MSPFFYMLNGISEPNLKQVCVTSLQDELQSKLQRSIAATKKDMTAISIGQIHQMALIASEKLCEQETFLHNLLDKRPMIQKACRKPDLQNKPYSCKTKDHFLKINKKIKH